MALNMVEFQESGVRSAPLSSVPAAYLALISIARENLTLDFDRDVAVVGRGDSLKALQNVLAGGKVRSSCEAGRDGEALFGPKLPDSPRPFRDVSHLGQLLTRYSVAHVDLQVL